MPDTPVTVDGASQKFTIRLPKGSGKLEVDPADGKRTLGVNPPKGKALQLRFKAGTGDGGEVTIPLGVFWSVIIEVVPPAKPAKRKS